MCRCWKLLPIFALVGLVGCHLTREAGLPADLGPGRGRVEQTFPADLGLAVRASLAALDQMDAKPVNGIVRANDAATVIGKPKWAGQTNEEYLPDDESFADLFYRQRLNVKGQEPSVFAPILLAYKGEVAGGKSVVVIIRSVPPDATKSVIMTRVGNDGDEAWSKKFLDTVAFILPHPPESPATPDAKPDPGLPSLPALPSGK